MTLDERAELAARATIRHSFTSYQDRLADLDPFDAELDDFEHRSIRKDAHDAVDRFVNDHRRESRA